jgi:putative membrane protein
MFYHGFGWGMGGWGMGFGVLFLVVLFTLLAAWLSHRPGIRAAGGGCCGPVGGHHHPGVNALDIARERYAKGEINKEQFEQIKHDLG